MKHKFYIVCGTSVLACAIAALIIRLSFVPSGSGIDNYKYFIYSGKSSEILADDANFKGVKATSVDTLIQQSDAIINCEFKGDRNVESNSFYTTVSVNKVYKGQQNLAGSNITVAEPISVFPDTSFINAPNGLMPLKTNQEYILLLKKMTVSKYRAKNDRMNNIYYLLGSSPFSEYCVSGDQATAIRGIKYPTLKSLSGYDIATDSQEVIDKYNAFRGRLFSEFNIS